MTTIYQHPDGHSIDFTDNTLIVTTDGGKSVSVPIGAYGLVSLADALEAAAESRQVEQVPRATTHTAADCAEQAGHAIGANCLDAILATGSQAEHSKALTNALLDLQRLEHAERAAAGFAVSLVSVIEQGLEAAGTGD